eukprot:g21453.t1
MIIINTFIYNSMNKPVWWPYPEEGQTCPAHKRCEGTLERIPNEGNFYIDLKCTGCGKVFNTLWIDHPEASLPDVTPLQEVEMFAFSHASFSDRAQLYYCNFDRRTAPIAYLDASHNLASQELKKAQSAGRAHGQQARAPPLAHALWRTWADTEENRFLVQAALGHALFELTYDLAAEPQPPRSAVVCVGTYGVRVACVPEAMLGAAREFCRTVWAGHTGRAPPAVGQRISARAVEPQPHCLACIKAAAAAGELSRISLPLRAGGVRTAWRSNPPPSPPPGFRRWAGRGPGL